MTESFSDLEALWTAAGGDPTKAETAAAIALAESGGDPTSIDNTDEAFKPGYHPAPPGASPEYSVGLWQINLLAHPSYTEAEMLDPAQNAVAAVAISSGGASFDAWTTFTKGLYQQYLPGGGGSDATTPAGPGNPADQTVTAPNAFRGWTLFRRAVNSDLPHSLDRAAKVRQATSRLL